MRAISTGTVCFVCMFELIGNFIGTATYNWIDYYLDEDGKVHEIEREQVYELEKKEGKAHGKWTVYTGQVTSF